MPHLLRTWAFLTLTYDPGGPGPSHFDFPRFIHKAERKLGTHIKWLRTYEFHQDGRPHLHAILQFNYFSGYSDRTKRHYMADQQSFLNLKACWSAHLRASAKQGAQVRALGHIDFMVPYSKGAFNYALKYILKEAGSTRKTIWRKIQASRPGTVIDASKTPTRPPDGPGNQHYMNSDLQTTPSSSPTTSRKSSVSFTWKTLTVKRASWSRDFDFHPFYQPKRHANIHTGTT